MRRNHMAGGYMVTMSSVILLILLLLSNTVASASSLVTPHRRTSRSALQQHTKDQQQQQEQVCKVSRNAAAWKEGLKNSLASALAAGCSKAILAPFDTIKTIQQHYRSSGTSLGLIQATRLIVNRPRGIWELYAGLGVSVLGSMPSVGLYFGVYSYCKRTIYPFLQQTLGSESVTSSLLLPQQQNERPKINDRVLWTISIAMSAAIGNTVASFSRVPYEVVKQNLQTGLYTSTFDAITDMAKTAGWRAFFPMGGVSIQMLRDIPYAMVTLLTYEYLRQTVVHPYKQQHPTASWCDMMAGAIAGGFGSYVTNPLDVIKTRLQINPHLYKGSIAICARATLDEGGAMAFLRGSVPRLLHKVPANGAFFLFYEFFRKLLQVDTTAATSGP